MHGATVFVEINCYERRGIGYSDAKILQHAIARTLADAITLTGRKIIDHSTIDFGEKLKQLNGKLQTLYAGTGAGIVVSIHDMSYDLSIRNTRNAHTSAVTEKYGSWTPHITIKHADGTEEVASVEESLKIIERIIEKRESGLEITRNTFVAAANAGGNKRSHIRDEELLAIDNDLCACTAMREDVRLLRSANVASTYGGRATQVLDSVYGAGRAAYVVVRDGHAEEYTSTNAGIDASDGEEVLRMWFELMTNPEEYAVAETSPGRLMVGGEGHAYNLAPTY